MTDHTSPPTTYEGDWPASPFSETDRHHLKTACCHLRRSRFDSYTLSVDSHPAIMEVVVSYADSNASLAIDVHIADSVFDCDLIASERFDSREQVTFNDDPHFLRDLGHLWFHLEADLLSQLATTFDLPRASKYLASYTVGPLGLRCTTVQAGSLACFASLFFVTPYMDANY